MKNINEIFASALERCLDGLPYGSKTKLCKAVGVQTSHLNSVLKREKSVSEEKRRAIAAYFGYSYDDFLRLGQAIAEGKEPPAIEEESEALTENELIESGFIKVPFSERMKLAAGGGGRIPVDHDTDTSKLIVHGPTLGHKNAKHLQGFRVGGDSMHPEIVENGLILADIRDNDLHHLKEGKIYVICWDLDDGECAVKRLRWAMKDKLLAIESANPFYETIFRKPQDVQLIGRVIWSWREH